jgi:hypothetical protein
VGLLLRALRTTNLNVRSMVSRSSSASVWPTALDQALDGLV